MYTRTRLLSARLTSTKTFYHSFFTEIRRSCMWKSITACSRSRCKFDAKDPRGNYVAGAINRCYKTNVLSYDEMWNAKCLANSFSACAWRHWRYPIWIPKKYYSINAKLLYQQIAQIMRIWWLSWSLKRLLDSVEFLLHRILRKPFEALPGQIFVSPFSDIASVVTMAFCWNGNHIIWDY